MISNELCWQCIFMKDGHCTSYQPVYWWGARRYCTKEFEEYGTHM